MKRDLNRYSTRNFWGTKSILLAYSRQDKGLVAIGKPSGQGEEWIHVKAEELEKVLADAKKEWGS